jgi:hypothetical protein
MAFHLAYLIGRCTRVDPFLFSRRMNQSEVYIAVVVQRHHLTSRRTQLDAVTMPESKGEQ